MRRASRFIYILGPKKYHGAPQNKANIAGNGSSFPIKGTTIGFPVSFFVKTLTQYGDGEIDFIDASNLYQATSPHTTPTNKWW